MPFKNPHPLYTVWQSMLRRCDNPNYAQYLDYGGRGISVCDRWKGADGFSNFCADMGPRPEGYTLDREDNDGNYEPNNCRWATRKEQQRNRRRTIFLDIEGTRYRAIELAELSGMKMDTIVARHAAGLSYEAIMSPERRVFTEGLALGGKASGAKKAARTHCLYGHEYNEENTRWRKDGGRECRACRRV